MDLDRQDIAPADFQGSQSNNVPKIPIASKVPKVSKIPDVPKVPKKGPIGHISEDPQYKMYKM